MHAWCGPGQRNGGHTPCWSSAAPPWQHSLLAGSPRHPTPGPPPPPPCQTCRQTAPPSGPLPPSHGRSPSDSPCGPRLRPRWSGHRSWGELAPLMQLPGRTLPSTSLRSRCGGPSGSALISSLGCLGVPPRLASCMRSVLSDVVSRRCSVWKGQNPPEAASHALCMTQRPANATMVAPKEIILREMFRLAFQPASNFQ